MTAWYTRRHCPSEATKQALGEFERLPKVLEGNKVGIQATLLKADGSGELMRASSQMPPDLDSGPTASTFHKINSLQKP